MHLPRFKLHAISEMKLMYKFVSTYSIEFIRTIDLHVFNRRQLEIIIGQFHKSILAILCL